MGSPLFTIPVFKALISSDNEIVAAYTHPDRLAGRGRKPQAPPIKELAEKNGIEVYQPSTLKSEAVVREMERLKPDLIVIAAFGQILPKEILEIPTSGCLNVHPSLLPKHRGPAPVAKTLLEGDREAGVSIMLLDEGMDTGPILAQEKHAIAIEDNCESLTSKLFERGAKLITEVIPGYVQGSIKTMQQDHNQASYSHKIRKEEGEIKWTSTAELIWRQIRALSPWPGTYTYWKGEVIKIVEATPGGVIEKPGEIGQVILSHGERGLIVSVITAQGSLELRTIQQQGKKKNSIDAFIRGHKGFVGSILPS